MMVNDRHSKGFANRTRSFSFAAVIRHWTVGASLMLATSCGGGDTHAGPSTAVAPFNIARAEAHGSSTPSACVQVTEGADQMSAIEADTGYVASDVTVDGASQGAITTYTFINLDAAHTISATFPEQSTLGLDPFGIKELYPSVGREWFNAWNTGSQRSSTWGVMDTDPGLAIRGATKVIIYGASGDRTGQMQVTGPSPRIYVRDSDTEAIPPADGAKTWNNVEVTFYATSTIDSGVGYAGLEAVVKTNHCPDSWDCQSRGYGGRMLFDGRIDFEKEVSHANGYDVRHGLDPWSGGFPFNRWIGFKLVARNCDNNTHVKLELYRELSLGNETNPTAPANGGTWELLGGFIDDGTWSTGYQAATAQCSFDDGKTDRSLPLTWANWSVYLRTDDATGELVQYYKWLSVREIAPLP